METFQQLYINQREDIYDMWKTFLEGSAIRPEETVDYTCGMFEGDQLIATGSLHKNIIKCVAVCKAYQGGATFNKLISYLMDEIAARGYHQYYVYTKPEYAQSFQYLGFAELARVNRTLVFLERAVTGIDDYLQRLKAQSRSGKRCSAIVMNANPFTLGHQHLVKTAAAQSDIVYVFVVSEDESAFPYTVRMELVRAGCSEFSNVIVVPTDNYIVSSQTFPSYFMHESEDVTAVQAQLDATLFKEKIAPALGITRRFLGEEPFSIATHIYNDMLKRILEPEIEVTVISRKQADGNPISASSVRASLENNGLDEIKNMVPQTTFEYLQSSEGMKIIEMIKNKRRK